jgi:hypothetical protein
VNGDLLAKYEKGREKIQVVPRAKNQLRYGFRLHQTRSKSAYVHDEIGPFISSSGKGYQMFALLASYFPEHMPTSQIQSC